MDRTQCEYIKVKEMLGVLWLFPLEGGSGYKDIWPVQYHNSSGCPRLYMQYIGSNNTNPFIPEGFKPGVYIKG